MEVDYYELLGVPVDASLAQIQSSYLARLQRLYDSAQSSGPLERASALEQMDLLRRAFSALSDPDKRASYDQSRTQSQNPPMPGATPLCPRCSGEVRATAHFCPRCGATLRSVEGLPLNLNPSTPAAPPVQYSAVQDGLPAQPAPVIVPVEPAADVPAGAPGDVPATLLETQEPEQALPPASKDASPPPIPKSASPLLLETSSTSAIVGLSGTIDYSPVMQLNTGYKLSIAVRLLPSQPDQPYRDAEQARLAGLLASAPRPLVRVIPYSPYLQIYPPYQDIFVTPGTEASAQFTHSLQRLPPEVSDITLHVAFHTQDEKLGETRLSISVAGSLTSTTSNSRGGLGNGLTIFAAIMISLLVLIGIFNMIAYSQVISYIWLFLFLLIALGVLGAGIYLRKKANRHSRVRF